MSTWERLSPLRTPCRANCTGSSRVASLVTAAPDPFLLKTSVTRKSPAPRSAHSGWENCAMAGLQARPEIAVIAEMIPVERFLNIIPPDSDLNRFHNLDWITGKD